MIITYESKNETIGKIFDEAARLYIERQDRDRDVKRTRTFIANAMPQLEKIVENLGYKEGDDIPLGEQRKIRKTAYEMICLKDYMHEDSETRSKYAASLKQFKDIDSLKQAIMDEKFIAKNLKFNLNECEGYYSSLADVHSTRPKDEVKQFMNYVLAYEGDKEEILKNTKLISILSVSKIMKKKKLSAIIEQSEKLVTEGKIDMRDNNLKDRFATLIDSLSTYKEWENILTKQSKLIGKYHSSKIIDEKEKNSNKQYNIIPKGDSKNSLSYEMETEMSIPFLVTMVGQMMEKGYNITEYEIKNDSDKDIVNGSWFSFKKSKDPEEPTITFESNSKGIVVKNLEQEVMDNLFIDLEMPTKFMDLFDKGTQAYKKKKKKLHRMYVQGNDKSPRIMLKNINYIIPSYHDFSMRKNQIMNFRVTRNDITYRNDFENFTDKKLNINSDHMDEIEKIESSVKIQQLFNISGRNKEDTIDVLNKVNRSAKDAKQLDEMLETLSDEIVMATVIDYFKDTDKFKQELDELTQEGRSMVYSVTSNLKDEFMNKEILEDYKKQKKMQDLTSAITQDF